MLATRRPPVISLTGFVLTTLLGTSSGVSAQALAKDGLQASGQSACTSTDPYREVRPFLSGELSKLVYNADIRADWSHPGTLRYQTNRREGQRSFEVDLATGRKRAIETPQPAAPLDATKAMSPDGRYEAYIREYNIFIRERRAGQEQQVTHDGRSDYHYGAFVSDLRRVNSAMRKLSAGPVPNLQWAPNSQMLVVARYDERGVSRTRLTSSTGADPISVDVPMARLRDVDFDRVGLMIVHLDGLSTIAVKMPDGIPLGMATHPTFDATTGQVSWNVVQWVPSSDMFYALQVGRGEQDATLFAVDPLSGAARPVIHEEADTSLGWAQTELPWRLAAGGNEIIWPSWRTGWAHLYRYGKDGKFKNAITTGPWSVRSLVHVNDRSGDLLIAANGREPGRFLYDQSIYRVRADGRGLRELIPESGYHTFWASPDGEFGVDQYSTPKQPPVSVLRRTDTGAVVASLETADVADLMAIGWNPPQVISAQADDGRTLIYGLMNLPRHFDPQLRYPVIERAYLLGVGGWTFSDAFNVDETIALTELGYVVVSSANRGGSWGRSRAFRDAYRDEIEVAGLSDRVAFLRQLFDRYPFLDRDRVGIYGQSFGGTATVMAMLHAPAIYKVGVATSGVYDVSKDRASVQVSYFGDFHATGRRKLFDAAAQENFVDNLSGDLLLMHGDMDPVSISQTIDLTAALQAHNKRYAFYVFPDGDHDLSGSYKNNLIWNFFTEHLPAQRQGSSLCRWSNR